MLLETNNVIFMNESVEFSLEQFDPANETFQEMD